MKLKNILILPLLAFLSAFSFCADETKVIGDTSLATAPYAWIWAYNKDNKTLEVYNAKTGKRKTTLTAEANDMMHVTKAGFNADALSTVWMAGGGKAYGFTQGFQPHGDHAHFVVPVALKTTDIGSEPVHIGVSPDGDRVAFADDADQNIYLLDISLSSQTSEAVLTKIDEGSSHSAALLSGEYLITTYMGDPNPDGSLQDNGWSKVIDISDPSNISVKQNNTSFGEGSHGDAYYESSRTAFIACTDGIYWLDLSDPDNNAPYQNGQVIPYPTDFNRTNFIFHSGAYHTAAGLHKSTEEDSTSNSILLLNLEYKTAETLTVANDATIDWNPAAGRVALSDDGKTLALSDVKTNTVYIVRLSDKSVHTITVSGASAGGSVALDYDGSHAWLASDDTIYFMHLEDYEVEGSFPLESSADWIFATSYNGEVVE